MVWNMPGYYFSELNRAIVSDDPMDSMRLSAAFAQAKLNSLTGSFWAPDYGNMFCSMPFYMPLGNDYLLNPAFAMWQTQNSMQNCWYGDSFNGGFGGFGTGFSDMGASNIGPMGTMMGNMGNFGGFGGGMGGVGMGGMFPGQQGGSVGGSGKTQAEKIANNEYNSLKTSAQKIANIKGLDPNVKSTLTAALNKSGTIEEKKQALKDAIATIGDKNIFKEGVIVDFKEDLAKIGYSFPTLKYFESGSTTTNDAKNIHSIVDELEVNLQQEGGDPDKLLLACGKNIIPVISYWNDNRSHENIIKFLAHKGKKSIPSDETGKTSAANAINTMAQALISEASSLCSENAEGTNNLKSAKNALASARAKLNLDGKLTEEQVNNLADAFNKLYVQIRMYKAQDVRNKVLKKYESLNDLEKGLIPDDIIVAETIEDLKREGFAAPTSYDRISRPKKAEVTITAEKSNLDNKPAKSQISGLVSNKSITKTDNKDVYVSETVEGKKYYTISKKDGKDVLVEAKGITSIDAEGKINGEYATVEDAIEAEKVTVEEVTPTVVQNRVQTKATVDKLKASGDIVLQKGGGYRSKNKGANGTEYYEINADGAFVKKGTNELVTSVPDENTFMDAQQEKLNRLIDEGKLIKVTSVIGRDDIYRSTGKNGKYYQYFIVNEYGLVRIKGYVGNDGKVYQYKEPNWIRKTFEELDYKKGDFVLNFDESKIPVKTVADTGSSLGKDDASSITKDDCDETPVLGYYKYKKGDKYFYEDENGNWSYLPGVTKIYACGTAKKNGKIVALRENEDPKTSGAALRKLIQNYSSKTHYDQYDKAYKKMCSFSKYESSQDIMDFIDGYEDSLSSWYILNNQHLCSQISTEDGATKDGTKKMWTVAQREWMLQTIAKKLLIVVKEYKLFNKDDWEYRDLEYYANTAGRPKYENGQVKKDNDKIVKNSWKIHDHWRHTTSMFNSARTGAANNMDNIIKEIRKRYKEQVGRDDEEV